MFLRKEKSGVYHIYRIEDGRKQSVTTKEKNYSKALKRLSEFKQLLADRVNKKVIPIKLCDFQKEILEFYQIAHAEKTCLGIKYYISILTQVDC